MRNDGCARTTLINREARAFSTALQKRDNPETTTDSVETEVMAQTVLDEKAIEAAQGAGSLAKIKMPRIFETILKR